MCIFIAALLLIVGYALLGKLDGWQLVEVIDGEEWLRVSGSSMLWELWPLWLFAFLAGVLFVLLALKLVPIFGRKESQDNL